MSQEGYPEGFDASQPYLEPLDPLATERPANFLRVAASTGIILEHVSNGANSTHVIIEGVPSRSEGYKLKDPLQNVRWSNVSADFDGRLTFRYVNLAKGVYTVTRVNGLVESVVTTFSTTQLTLTDNYASDGGGSGDPNWETRPDCPVGHVIRREQLSTAILWSPAIVLHAPYQGQGWLSGGASEASTTFIIKGGWSGSLTTGWMLEVWDGETAGIFQLVEWGYFREYRYSSQCSAEEFRTAAIIDYTPWGSEVVQDFLLWGNSRYTDADDLMRVSGYGPDGTLYGSITFENRYARRDYEVRAYQSGYWMTRAHSACTLSEVGGSITFAKGTIGFDVIRASSNSCVGASYEYYFYPSGRWYADRLGTEDVGLAFCFSNRTGC